MISSPSTYRVVQHELIAEIHRTSIWPVVVTVDGNISKPNKTDFIDKDGSYTILIPGGDFKSFSDEFLGLAIGRVEFTRFWNSEARFFVDGANEFSMSQKTRIFVFFSRLRMYNCFIVSREHYVFDKGYIRPIKDDDEDTDMKLGVYTWFPYQSSDSCTDVNDITLLDSWVISSQGQFTKNTDLFPRKISKGHSQFATYYFNHTTSNWNVLSYVAGLEIALLRVVLEQMNMTFFNVPLPKISNGM